jgi:Endodeoxyribonuclease RusA
MVRLGTSRGSAVVTDSLRVVVSGRPAPQGSKQYGQYGQMREQSAYLPAWRRAVKKAVYEWYRQVGVEPADLPLFVGAVGCSITFRLDTGDRIDGPPDIDKLLRSTFDALGKPPVGARVFEDDARVVRANVQKIPAGALGPGALIEVWRA